MRGLLRALAHGQARAPSVDSVALLDGRDARSSPWGSFWAPLRTSNTIVGRLTGSKAGQGRSGVLGLPVLAKPRAMNDGVSVVVSRES
jgi:hypothetical protein